MPVNVFDQGNLGSCTACAICEAYEFDLLKQKFHDFVPSRLFVYYNERSLEGTVAVDSGASLRDGIKVVAKYGVCQEAEWPYSDKDPGPYQTQPSHSCFKAALRHQVLRYSRIYQKAASFKVCLTEGYPFVFGFAVYASFESDEVARTGTVPLPGKHEECMGGHAVLCCGYSDKTQRFLCRNSWGKSWGQAGHFTLPYSYVLDNNLADDFWTIRLVEG
jgi:C1A family cysteine protease